MASRDDAPALRLSGLTRRFGARLAVSNVDLDIEEGETIALLGPNGAGKSTTIAMICGLLKPSQGRIEIAGHPARSRRRAPIGYCPQANVFYPDLTVLENLRFAGALWKVPFSVRRWRAVRLAHELGLGDHKRKRAGDLSGGMQRRLTLGIALMHDPALLVIEEPEAGLDPHSRVAVRRFLAEQCAGKTVIFSSHNMDEVARLADRVAILDGGILMAVGTPAELADKVGKGKWVDLDGRPAGSASRPLTMEDVFLALTRGTPN